MTFSLPLSSIPAVLRAGLIIAVVGLLSACAGSRDIPTRTFDPQEEQNREAHKFNLGLDRVILRPTSEAYGTVVPAPVQVGISNVASNLGVPGDVVNNVLQVRIGQAAHNTMRFLINSTLGLAGLFDVASEMGIEPRETDFGETLYYWGAPEGPYVEIPIMGPSTSRHTVGRFVDLATNPTSLLITGPGRAVASTASIADVFGARYRNTDLIDGILYESADSYAQARLIYLQNRRFKLRSGSGVEEDYLDPYADPYGDPYEDPYDVE